MSRLNTDAEAGHIPGETFGPGSLIRRVSLVCLIVLGFVAAASFLVVSFQTFLLVFTGVLLGFYLHAIKRFFMRWLRLPSSLSYALVLILVAGLSTLFVTAFIPLVADQLKRLADQLPEIANRLQNAWQQSSLARWLEARGASLSELDGINGSSLGGVLSQASSALTSTMGLLAGVAIIGLISLFVAAEPKLYLNGLRELLPSGRVPRFNRFVSQLAHVLRWWMVGQMVSMTVLGLCTTIGLFILDVPFAVLLGLLAAFLTFIPNLGPIIASIPAIALGLADSPGKAAAVAILYIIIQNIEGMFITPLIHRRIIALPPVLIIVTQLLLASSAGLVGVLLAMPIVATGLVMVRTLYLEPRSETRDHALITP